MRPASSEMRSPEISFFLKASEISHLCQPGRRVISSSVGVGFFMTMKNSSSVSVPSGIAKTHDWRLIFGAKNVFQSLYRV